MTREEMEELKGLAASMGLYDDRKPCKRAVILGKAIEEVSRYKEAIENIKAEIWQEHDSCGNFSDGVATAYGLELAIEIINKHLKGVS